MNHVTKQSDMPKGPHWAIIKYKTILEPGYEGGTDSKDIVEYIAYTKKEDWEAGIIQLEERLTREPYTALEVKPAVIKRTISVS